MIAGKKFKNTQILFLSLLQQNDNNNDQTHAAIEDENKVNDSQSASTAYNQGIIDIFNLNQEMDATTVNAQHVEKQQHIDTLVNPTVQQHHDQRTMNVTSMVLVQLDVNYYNY